MTMPRAVPSAPGAGPVRRSWRQASALALLLAAASSPVHLHAQEDPPPGSIDIAAQPLAEALRTWSRLTGRQVVGSADELAGVRTAGASGRMSPDEALFRLLAGTGLAASVDNRGNVVVRRSNPVAQEAPSMTTLPDVTVAAPVSDVARAGLFGDQRVVDTPYSITGFNDSLIRDQQSKTMSDVVVNDSSVRSIGQANGDTEAFQIRGLQVLANEVSLDGLYCLHGVRRSGISHASRVEVLKGPNAVINGLAPFGSVGGGVNVVPKRAGPDPVTDVFLEAASRSSFGGGLDIGRRFGPADSLGIRVNAVVRDGETAVRNADNRFGSLDVALDYRGGPLRATLDLGYQQDDWDSNQQLYSLAADVPVPRAPSGSANLSQRWGRYRSDDQRFLAGVHYDITENWTASLRYGQLRHTDDYASPTSVTIINTAGDFTYRTIAQPAVFRTRTAEVGLRGNLRTGVVGHKVALNATRYTADNRFAFSIFGPLFSSNLYSPVAGQPPSFAGTPESASPGNERTLQTVALADTLSLLDDRLLLTLGIRHQSIDVTNYVNASGNASGTVSGVIDQSKTSPVYAALYKLDSHWSVYGNVTQALASGPQAPGGTVNAGTVLAPIVAKSYELGIKTDQGRWGGSAALFQTTQQVGITDPATRVFSADGENRIRGAEVNLYGSPVRSLRVVGGLTVLDAEQARTAGGINDGRRAVGVSRTLVGLHAEWLTPFARDLSLNARVLHSGDQPVNAANTAFIPSWTRYDIGAKYVVRGGTPVTLRATIENLSDRDYWVSAANGLLRRGAPRTALLSAEFSF